LPAYSLSLTDFPSIVLTVKECTESASDSLGTSGELNKDVAIKIKPIKMLVCILNEKFGG
jgi:hypothetical protein